MAKSKNELKMVPVTIVPGMTSIVFATGKKLTFTQVPAEFEKDILKSIVKMTKPLVVAIRKAAKKAKSEQWTEADLVEALKQGWIVTNDSNDRTCIAKVDDPEAWEERIKLDYTEPKFKHDEDALSFVKRQARKGDKLALKAMAQIGRPYNTKLADPSASRSI